MSAEQVALIPQCAECGDFWLPDDQARWRAYLDTEDEVVIFCAECADREFEARDEGENARGGPPGRGENPNRAAA